MEAPRRCFELTLTIAGDTEAAVLERLQEAVDFIKYMGVRDCAPAKAAGIEATYRIALEHRPEMTPDAYREATEAFCASLDAVPTSVIPHFAMGEEA